MAATKKIDSKKTKSFIVDDTEESVSQDHETVKKDKITKLLFDIPEKRGKTTVLKEFDFQLLKITQIREINEKTRIYRLASATRHKLADFKAGQYIEVKTKVDGILYSRKYSLCSSPHELEKDKYYEIMVQYHTNSIVSKKIFKQWKVGSKVVTSVPIGNFYYWDNFEYKNICAITNGVGVAPILSLAKTVVGGDLKVSMTIFNTATSEEELLLKDEFANLDDRSKKVKVINVVTRTIKPEYERGPINIDIINKYCNIKDCTFYICGMKSTCDHIISKITSKTHKLDENSDK